MSDSRLGGADDERTMLNGFLDWQRAVAERKVDGLSDADATRPMPPSGLSLLGIIQHLGWAECLWFPFRLAGEDVDLEIKPGGGNDHTFLLAPDATVESVLAYYRAQTERARAVVAGIPSLDQLAAREHSRYGRVTMRWVLLHLIEETARHNGHLDLMREAIDGRTGD